MNGTPTTYWSMLYNKLFFEQPEQPQETAKIEPSLLLAYNYSWMPIKIQLAKRKVDIDNPLVTEMTEKVVKYSMALIFNKATHQFRIQGKYKPLAEREVFVTRELATRAYNAGFLSCNTASVLWEEWKAAQPVEAKAKATLLCDFHRLTRTAWSGPHNVQDPTVLDYSEIEEVIGRRMLDEKFDNPDWDALAKVARAELDDAKCHTSSEAAQAAESARLTKECLRDNADKRCTDGFVDMNSVHHFMAECYDELHALEAAIARSERWANAPNVPRATKRQRSNRKWLKKFLGHMENELMSGRYGLAAEGCFELQSQSVQEESLELAQDYATYEDQRGYNG